MLSTGVLGALREIRCRLKNSLAISLAGLCCGCGLASDRPSPLCTACLQSLPRPIAPCSVCGQHCSIEARAGSESVRDSTTASGPSTVPMCNRCRLNPPPFALCRGAFAYSSPIDRLVSDYKFSGRVDIGAALSHELSVSIAEHYPSRCRSTSGGAPSSPTAVIAVPLHSTRLVSRGFNQAERVARTVARRGELTNLSRAIERTRKTRPQTEMTSARDRRENLRNAFRLRSPQALACHRHVLLIDDVVTTGATVAEVTKTLHSAGIERVDVWCLARADRAH